MALQDKKPPGRGTFFAGLVKTTKEEDAKEFAEQQRERRWLREQEAQAVEQRLAQVLLVNRTLHGNLAKKKREVDECKKAQQLLELRLLGRGSEDPARKVRIEDLQTRLQEGSRKTASSTKLTCPISQAKEAELAGKKVISLEKKVEDLNEANLALSETHRQDRAQVSEQQSRLRTLARRERELAKQLDFIANKLNEAIRYKLSKGEEGPATDFRNLPGLRLNKLTGIYSAVPPTVLSSEPPTCPVTPNGAGSEVAYDGGFRTRAEIMAETGEEASNDDVEKPKRSRSAKIDDEKENTRNVQQDGLDRSASGISPKGNGPNAGRPSETQTQAERSSSGRTEAGMSLSKTCNKCKSIFMEDAEFCRKCGEKRSREKELVVQPRCVDCGNLFMADSEFCRKCGKARPACDQERARLSGEGVQPRSPPSGAATDGD